MCPTPSVARPANPDAATLTFLKLLDTTVSFLPDGVHHVEAPTHYPHSPAELWDEHVEVIDDDGLLVMSVGSILIQTPTHNVLVDAGFGPHHADISKITDGAFRGDLIGGDLLESLRQVGLAPADIHAVVLTHLHIDHVGWIHTPDDPSTLTFPEAKIFVHAAEIDYWTHETDPLERAKGATDEQISAIRSVLTMVEGRTEIYPGVTIVPTPGHTPGHISVLVRSGVEQVLVLGDALHCPVEFQHTGMQFVFDQDNTTAQASRRQILSILNEPDSYFAGGHFPSNVFGRVGPGDGEHDAVLHYLP